MMPKQSNNVTAPEVDLASSLYPIVSLMRISEPTSHSIILDACKLRVPDWLTNAWHTNAVPSNYSVIRRYPQMAMQPLSSCYRLQLL